MQGYSVVGPPQRAQQVDQVHVDYVVALIIKQNYSRPCFDLNKGDGMIFSNYRLMQKQN